MTCSVETCERLSKAKGLCHAHAERLRRHGDVQADVPIGKWAYDPNTNLPNPWSAVSPPCPGCGLSAVLWADGPLQWFCPPCRRRFA